MRKAHISGPHNMMCSRRERMEIILHGGKPWGFSIKGGSESNKPLVISKLEFGGKAESSGLCVGDIIFSVNNVPLSGVRSEAIKLVKTSGKNLMLEIERGVLPPGKRNQYYNARSKQPHDNDCEHYRYGPGEEIKTPPHPNHVPSNNPEYGSESYYTDSTGNYPPSDQHILNNDPKFEMYAEGGESRSSTQPRLEDNVIPTKSINRGSASDIWSSSPSSISTFSPPREGAIFSKHGSEPKLFDRERGLQHSPYYVSNESVDRYSAISGSQGNVRMRRPGRARDRIAERPSSWHASKHTEIDRAASSPTSNLYEDRSMRSPGSSGCQSPQQHTQSGFYYPANQPQIKRKLKGWSETGDLKSTLKKDINGSKDSLISSSSRHSYRSGRLSVSSSRSSGNMSSSRGSLDNLDSYHGPDSHESIPEVVHGISVNSYSGHSRKNSSTSHPQVGNVDSKKSMFEKYSLQEQGNVSSSTNQDSAPKPWNKYHASHDVAAKSSNLPWKKQYHEMGKALPSSNSREELRSLHNTHENPRRSSLSPSGASDKKIYSHDQYEMTYNSENAQNVPSLKSLGYRDTNINNNASVHRRSIEENETADAKLVKTPFILARDAMGSPKVHDYVQLPPPSPPARDSSSRKGVMQFQQLQNMRNQANADESNQCKQLLEPKTVVSPSNDRAPIFPNDPTEQTAVVYPVPPVTPNIASPVTEDQKAVDNASRSARMFGVMAYGGDRKNVVAKTITISSPNRTPVSSPVLPRAKTENITTNPKTGPSPRYEHIKDAYAFTDAQMENKLGPQPGTDYASRAKSKQSIIKPKEIDFTNEAQLQATNFTRFDHNKARASSRYGEIWKTPQNHRRSRSSDANSIIRDSPSQMHNAKSDQDSSVLSVFKPKDSVLKLQPETVEKSNFEEKTVTQPTNKFTGPKIHKPQSSFDAKSRQTIYHSSSAQDDDITRQLEESLPIKPLPTKPEPGNEFTGSSIVQALRNSRRNSAGLVKSGSGDSATNIDHMRRKKSTTASHSLSPSIQEMNQDEDDEAFASQTDEYTNNIKGMSKKVLRVTSFTRRDLELSPSSCPFDQRRQMFEYPKLPVTKEEGEQRRRKPIQYIHGRSRSQGNELEEGSKLITSSSSRESVLSSGKSDDENLVVPSRKPRPKSAGNQRNRANSKVHEPKLHQSVLTPNARNASYMQMKAGSLPRNMYVSPNFTSPEHHRVEVEVRPSNSPDTLHKPAAIVPRQVQQNPQSRTNVRNAILDYVQKKTGNTKSLKTSRAKSSSNFYPQQPMTEAKLKEEEEEEEEEDTAASQIRKPVQLTVTGPPLTNGFRQFLARESRTTWFPRNVPVRAKSTSSLLEDNEVSLPVPAQKVSDGDRVAKPPSDFSDQRSSSLENLTAESISSPSESSHSKMPSDWKNHVNNNVRGDAVPHRMRTRSSSDSAKTTAKIQPPSPPHKTTNEATSPEPVVQPPPRTKRQRYSQSSASSATTVSTLSSFSSSSSTSLQASSHKNLHQIPPLEEQDASDETSEISANDERHNSARRSSIKSPKSPKQDKSSSTASSVSPPASGVTHQSPPTGKHRNFNSGTYKIVKGMRAIDPSIKIPVVYPEDDESPHMQEGTDLSNAPFIDDDQPSPQVPHQRRASERTSIDSLTSSSSSHGSLPVSVSSSRRKSSTEKTPSPNKTQKSSRRSKPPMLGPDMLPPPPPPPPASADDLKCEEMRRQLREMGKFPSNEMDLPPPPTPPALPPKPQSSHADEKGPTNPNVIDTYREQTYLLGTDSSSDSNPTSKRNSQDALDLPRSVTPPSFTLEADDADTDLASSIPYENIKLKNHEEDKTRDNYVNVCVDVQSPTANEETLKDEQENSMITSKLNEELTPSSLTKAIIKNDKTLAQVLSLTNKKTLDYMHGILPSSRDIVEAGIRYRKSKPVNSLGKDEGSPNDPSKADKQPGSDPTSNASTLPASDTYYQTSASKAKIMNLVQEKVEGGEIDDSEDIESIEEISSKKVELISSITHKMSELQSVKDLIKIEMKENEELGKEVNALAKSVCTSREHEKFNTFVEEVDKIINLLLSLSGRLARVENALASLSPDAKPEERNSLLEKKEKLTLQHEEAKMLKDNVDKRQKTVSEILASYLNTEQFADYEHYIKMKTALIMEQRELDDKMKLGAEQMQCLRDSLSEDWLEKLEKMLAAEMENKEGEGPDA